MDNRHALHSALHEQDLAVAQWNAIAQTHVASGRVSVAGRLVHCPLSIRVAPSLSPAACVAAHSGDGASSSLFRFALTVCNPGLYPWPGPGLSRLHLSLSSATGATGFERPLVWRTTVPLPELARQQQYAYVVTVPLADVFPQLSEEMGRAALWCSAPWNLAVDLSYGVSYSGV